MNRRLRDTILAARLAAQGLTHATARSPERVVGHLLAVQSQDAPLARLAVAQRAGCHTAAVAAAVDAGRIVRTHVLRPTWHYVLRDDLPWLLELTAGRTLSGFGARHAQLGLAEGLATRGVDAILAELAAEADLTRAELQERLLARGTLQRTPVVGSQLGHLLLIAELEALIASGPLKGDQHTYRPWAEPAPGRDRTEAVAELARRFFTSHGPASIGDLMRWVKLPKSELTAAVGALGADLEALDADGVTLYSAPGAPAAPRRAQAFLLSSFDEAVLSYRDVPWPRPADYPLADAEPRLDAGGGPVLEGLRDVGTWHRTLRLPRLTIRLRLAASLSDAARGRVIGAVGDAVSRIAWKGVEVMLEEDATASGVRVTRRG